MLNNLLNEKSNNEGMTLTAGFIIASWSHRAGPHVVRKFLLPSSTDLLNVDRVVSAFLSPALRGGVACGERRVRNLYVARARRSLNLHVGRCNY